MISAPKTHKYTIGKIDIYMEILMQNKMYCYKLEAQWEHGGEEGGGQLGEFKKYFLDERAVDLVLEEMYVFSRMGEMYVSVHFI